MSTATPGTPSKSNAAVNLPAAQKLVRVVPHTHGDAVHLPRDLSQAAVLRYLQRFDATATIERGPTPASPGKRGIPDRYWAIRLRCHLSLVRRMFVVTPRCYIEGSEVVLVYPADAVLLAPSHTEFMRLALELAKPDETDADGRPHPWAPPVPRVTHELTPAAREDDAHALGPDEALPPLACAAPTTAPPIHDDASIQRWCATLSQLAGFDATPELAIFRSETNRLGFVRGFVWFRPRGPALRVIIEVCPNADLAEILATLVHELAHPLSAIRGGSGRHDLMMKQTMVDLAARQWGENWFGAARERVNQATHVVDGWLATCIRAALRDTAPPAARAAEDDQMARILGRLKKLRDLGADQCGRPEGISATAAANDLVTCFELGLRGGELNDIDPEQMIDRWRVMADGAVWRRTLVHAVAHFFDVFTLATPANGRMHLFGTYADVVAAEYLIDVSEARIERACAAHIESWKKQVGRTTGGETRREKTAFCISAVMAFHRKLQSISQEDGAPGDGARAGLARARNFADDLHAQRGLGWTSGGVKRYRQNEAGEALGNDMEVLFGVDSDAPAGRLGHR